jgi:hypothetical protein
MNQNEWRSRSGGRFILGAGEPFRLDDAQISTMFRAQLTPRIADLLDIAMECYACDRLTKRSLKDPIGRGWCRSLPVTLPVRDIAFWREPDVSAALESLLVWLTGDDWQPSFVEHHGFPRSVEDQGTLFSLGPAPPAAVGCFSGGLDSFGGVAVDLGENPDLQLVLVGVSGTPRARNVQRGLGNGLSQQTNRVMPLLVTANLVGAKRRPQDRQQRTRGLVFLSLAAATALLADVNEIRVYENGIGGINLPYGHAQIGAHMARSAHPRTLLDMQRLIDMLGEGAVRFRAPRIYDTKAQLVQRIPTAFRDLARRTFSCDTWSSDRQPREDADRPPRCGRCSSCLLRRQALHAAGWGSVDAEEPCRVDAFAAGPKDKESFELRLMLSQAADLQLALAERDPWSALVDTFPQLVTARDALVELGDDGVEERLVKLYRSYVHEWHDVPSPLVQRFLGQDLAA